MKEHSVLFSFIIPVYNGEPYLNRCLDSIFNQEADCEYEVIAVDDGSTDRSFQILQEYKDHPNLHVTRIENSGVSVARNTGLRICKGEYIVFLDCDDYLADAYFSSLSPVLKQKPLLVAGNYYVSTRTEHEKRLLLTDAEIELKPHAGIQEFLFGNLEPVINGTLSNKVYSHSVIQEHSVSFIEGKTMSEDWMFNAEYLEHIDTITTVGACLFHYYRNEQSVTHRYNRHYTQDIIQFIDEIRALGKRTGATVNDTDLALFYLKRWFGVLNNEAKNPDYKLGYQRFCEYLQQPFFQNNCNAIPFRQCGFKCNIYRFLTNTRLFKPVYSMMYRKHH